MMAAPTVPFTAGFVEVPGGVTSSHVPAAGQLVARADWQATSGGLGARAAPEKAAAEKDVGQHSEVAHEHPGYQEQPPSPGAATRLTAMWETRLGAVFYLRLAPNRGIAGTASLVWSEAQKPSRSE